MSLSGLFQSKMQLPKIFKIIFFEESRKVCFGFWGFAVCTALTWFNKIPNTQWIECFVMCSILVGGGTLMDKWLNIKGNTDADKAPPTNTTV